MRKLTFQQQVFTGFSITLFLVFALGLISYVSIRKLQKNESLTAQTYQVLTTSKDIWRLLVQAETSQRGYLITKDLAYLEQYKRTIGYVSPFIVELKAIVAENPAQVARADSLMSYATAKLEEMRRILSLNDQVSPEAAQKALRTNRGKLYMEKIDAVISEIQAEETLLLGVRKSNSRKSVNQVIWVIGVGCLMMLTMVVTLLTYIRQTFKKQKLIEERVRQTNDQLKLISKENQTQNWLLTGMAQIDNAMRGEREVGKLASRIIVEISEYLDAHVSALYILDEKDQLQLAGSYAFEIREGNNTVIKLGDGLVGQVALSKKPFVLEDVPSDYVKVVSGLGELTPHSILIQPFTYQDQIKGVIELGFLSELTPLKKQFVQHIAENLGVALHTAQANLRLKDLFEETQQQAEELESQQEELRTTNEELMNKTELLQASEEELRVQQEELQQMNAELQEKAVLLDEKNKSIDKAREAISIKAKELEQSSKYKSEFLANMSHELRTPLNSILILARILKENKNENLSADQIKYANVIHNAGSDLLTLINDILDLSKIESGKIDIHIEDVPVKGIKTDIEHLFTEVAKNKKVHFKIEIDSNVPEMIASDRIRIEQILRNLLSNAFKFTPANGSVTLTIKRVADGHVFHYENLNNQQASNFISFSVTDTGIGISEDKQQLIFEAFQQEDGSTSRKYGGTGLGLSISRELSILLGGEITLESKQGAGSTFSLYLPIQHQDLDVKELTAPISKPEIQTEDKPLQSSPKKPSQEKHEPTVLIIEDDENFAEVLKDYAAERGFAALWAGTGETGLDMAKTQHPDAIILDIMLPGMNGWEVLKELKKIPEISSIPVHLMSAGDEKRARVKKEGAVGFLKKPVEKDLLDKAFSSLISSSSTHLAKALIVEDHEVQSNDLKEKLEQNNIKVMQAFSGEEAKAILKADADFGAIILDVKLPDMSGLDLLDYIKSQQKLAPIPVVINTAMELDKDSLARIMAHTDAMVLKNSKSNERLLDEVNLFMNKVKNVNAPTFPFKQGPPNPITLEKSLKNKTVLIVDDDMRNIFALSTALQEYELKIEIAHNGKDALQKLEECPATDLILMDLMMPEMDGYQAMTAIRKQRQFKKTPIIALTAKAMKDDREKCIKAGANDYISKPVDLEKLLSLMRVWLS